MNAILRSGIATTITFGSLVLLLTAVLLSVAAMVVVYAIAQAI